MLNQTQHNVIIEKNKRLVASLENPVELDWIFRRSFYSLFKQDSYQPDLSLLVGENDFYRSSFIYLFIY